MIARLSNRGRKHFAKRRTGVERKKAGLTVERKLTKSGEKPLDEVEYTKRSSLITNPDGSVVFKMDDAEVPSGWSQLATDILVSKYFRKRGVPGKGHEHSARQVVYRIAHTIAVGGNKAGYFATDEDAENFEAELEHLLINQKGAFNSPVWFNCGLYHEYGIEGSGGNWYWDQETEEYKLTKNSYEQPQCSACFIQSVDDDLMSIFDLAKNEAKLFKYGSGTGTNFSHLRSRFEKLSGGGTSSGLMSFLEVLDRGAGATKSGGTTRRAAKMVTLDIDHPEIVDFVNWKVNEEKKVAALIGSGYSSDFNGEAYKTVSGQNSNNSVRVSDDFMDAYLNNGQWETTFRTTGEVCEKHDARDLMRNISSATWHCADPGLQFDTTINKWHTCKESGRINASNPCSEYMFLDNSACNLGSLNLMKFYDTVSGRFDVEGFKHACRIFIIAQEILVDFSSYPTEPIATNSHDFRPLGLGYANMGSLIMVKGIPYDSEEARTLCSAITAVMCASAYRTSAEIAAAKGPFPRYEENRASMLDVIRMHRDAAFEITETPCTRGLVTSAREEWDHALASGSRSGFRNSQVTVLAPTGTIGLLMDCDTTGIEPDFALVKFKKLAGGGYFKIINQSVPMALNTLGYTSKQVDDIVNYICGTASLSDTPHINEESLRDKGFTDEDLAKVEKALPGVFDLKFAFTPFTLGKETLSRLGYTEDDYTKPGFDILHELGFSNTQVEEASTTICGCMTIEGAPHLKSEHLPVFDCANKCGNKGTRYLAPMSHIKMMSAAQTFLSGAISKTINLPNEITPEEIEKLYLESWRAGLKAVALYRDGSKMCQPLNSKSDEKKKPAQDADAEEDLAAAAAAAAAAAPAEQQKVLERRRLPKKRAGFTQEARVGGHKVYLRTGQYDDGTLGEIFIDMHKEGAALRSIMNCFAMAVSMGLQYGVPLQKYVDCFTFTRFEPQGMVDHPNIKMSTSVIDFVFRLLGMEYLGRTDFVQVKPTKDEDVKLELETTAAREMQSKKEQTEAEKKVQVIKADRAKEEVEVKATFVPVKTTGTTSTAAGISVATATGSSVVVAPTETKREASGVSQQLSGMMGDAPFCDSCGHVTVRNGSCYKCLNCGNSMGCS